MSEVFDGYERQYCEISAALSRKCTSALQLDGEIKKQKASEIKSGIDDAENLIRKMDLEARSLQPSIKAGLLAKLREYKSDLNNLKSELKRITNPNPNQAAREELLESGMADTLAASADQRGRLLVSTERLNHSTDRVKESRRTMLETEELGVSILQDLHQQRQSLLHAHGTVQPVFTMAGTGGSGLQIVSEKLSETNYASWAVAVELYVEGHDKLDILHGTKVKPDEKDPSFRTWRRDNIQLMTWMLNSVNSGIKQIILHNKTAYDMWKTLEQMYGRRHDMLRTYQISSQIFKLEQGSMSVTNYFATLKGLWDEFDYYRMENWSSTDDHQRYLKLLEKDRIIKFLDGLTAEFESLKGQILGLDPTSSREQVYYKILSEEGRKRTMNNKGISTGGPPIEETSVFIGSANKFRPGGTKRQGDRFCRHCKRTNHDSDFCWEKYPEKKPEKFKHNAKKAPNSSNIAIQKLESEETIGSSVSSITGLSSTDIVNLQHLLSRLQASSSASTPADSTPFQVHTGIRGLRLSVTGPSFYSPWVIDSGATDHMTNAANSFISYSLSSGQEKVIIADGTKATVAGKGSIKLTDHFFLSSALHVSSVSINLLSVSSITKQLQCSVTFFPDHCVFQDLETKQTIGTGRERKYVLDLLKETGKRGSRPASTPIEVNHDLTSSSGEDLTSLEKGTYQRLVGKLLYLSMTRPDITYVVSVVSQYMHAPKTIHMKAVDRILRYLKSCPGKGLLFKGGDDLKLHGVDDNIGKSRKILTSMSRRMDRNKWIIGGIIAALVFAILIILYFKLVH
ncbi:hypothetical protein ZIOFF_035085 [Zingiber officinale]|uniref:Uncharacterized protein n=1 Tax=Zingiber officinale TaxID=94328 RepID=A0A8J5L2E5_ZINOF|nr:hypothetical protein ZIOFF_035085 [Zingiber officinale]